MKRFGRASFILVVIYALMSGTLPWLPGSAEGAQKPKVTICHFPPGNPSNVHQITVGAAAVTAHVTNHHDAVCADGASNCCFESGSSPSVCTSFASDVDNCGACGNVCTVGTACVGGACECTTPGTTLCAGACVNEQEDENNCGACGNVCTASQVCTAGTCTEKTVASSCLPSSSLSVLIQSNDVTAYVPRGQWTSGSTGVNVVRIEGAPMAPTTVATAGVVNSCSSCSSAACGGGVTVCTGNMNDVYVITPPATLSATPTANATAFQSFSGGMCQTCGVAIDAATGTAWIAEGSLSSVGQLEPYSPSSNTFGPVIGLFGVRTSEDIAVNPDPLKKRILSAGGSAVAFEEGDQFQIIDITTGAVYNAPSPSPFAGLELDATAEDCSTGVAIATVESCAAGICSPVPTIQKLAFVNLSAPTLTPGSPGSWSAPTNVQDFSPDFVNLTFGTNGLAVAPGSHLAVVAGEFGGAGFAVIQLPATVTPATVPAATDWVSANVPNDPSTAPWSMGFDPHTVTAYVSPNGGTAFALMTNAARTFLVKIDMALLLSAPRLPGTHTANPALIPAGTFSFFPQ